MIYLMHPVNVMVDVSLIKKEKFFVPRDCKGKCMTDSALRQCPLWVTDNNCLTKVSLNLFNIEDAEYKHFINVK